MSKTEYAEQLYVAIHGGDREALQSLLEEKKDVNVLRTHSRWLRGSDFENIYPLEAACKYAPEMVDDLLEAGAKVDVVDEYISSTPLIHALASNKPYRFALARKLVDLGANLDHVDENGRTALNYSVRVFESDDEETRKLGMEMLKCFCKKCDVKKVIEESEDNPLSVAARFNNVDALTYILENNVVDVNCTNNGYTPLMRAALAKNPESCILLLEHGADMNVKANTGKSAYDYALQSEKDDVISVFESFR